MVRSKLKYIILFSLFFFAKIPSTMALVGVVNVNDSLTLRNMPSTNGGVITKFYNATELNILDTNAGVGNGCNSNWYKVSYGEYTGYSCGEFIILKNTDSDLDDDSYSSSNYQNPPNGDGTIMCYEDTGSIGIRSSVNGARTGAKLNCGESVEILKIENRSGELCPYWYQVKRGNDIGYVCGYFINTTKLSSLALEYYQSNSREDYEKKLKDAGFPNSYIPYLLELHARRPNWNFVAEKLNMNFDDAVNGESGNGASLLQSGSFDKGYLSTNSNTYNLWSDTYILYSDEVEYYNASKEAIAYYMDPRNYLNEKYIFGFETLEYSDNQNSSVVGNIISGQNFFNSIYSKNFGDGTGSATGDIISSSRDIGISAVHVASRIKQEMGTNLDTTDSRLGGTFTYNGVNYSGYYNFFNIKCTGCTYKYAGYAYEHGWNTPYKGIYGGAKFLYGNYISLNQDTIYYEKFDVSTSDGDYTHQFQQNIAAVAQEGGLTYNGYINSGLTSYLDTSITFVIPVYENMPNYAVTAPKLGSPNNWLSEITINGNTISGFSYNTYNYNVYLSKNTTSVDISAKGIVGSSNITGIGSISILNDNQTNQIIVTAENGKTRIYTINFIREAMEGVSVNDAMNNSGFKYNDNYLFGISPGTNVSQIIGNISNYNHTVGVVIKDANSNIKTNDTFKTGDIITITGNDGAKTYTALIYGDVNGDGKITAVDYVNVKNYIMKSSNLTGVYQLAADVNRDGKITAVDYVNIKNSIMGKSNISQ